MNANVQRRLTAQVIANPLNPGKYSDGNGLTLQVSPKGTKSWVVRYNICGKIRHIGLGPMHLIDITEAREKAQRIRLLAMRGIDPLQERKPALFSRKKNKKDKTFRECTKEFIVCHSRSWKSYKNTLSWEASLRTYAYPYFGNIFVREISTQHILEALEPIWLKQIVTASRVRGRIERVLAWATITGYREGDNPARWKGHLKELLSPPNKIRHVQHHSSMPYQQIASFLKTITTTQRGKIKKTKGYRALIFTILTACRSKEVLHAQWEEIDFENAIWNIPKERMKSGRSHRVPLTTAMLNILYEQKVRDPIWVFPGKKPGQPLSNDTIRAMIRRLVPHETVHGFRSTFRVWAAEQTRYPREVAELALAHTIGTKVEAAYQRSDLFKRRRALMQDWSEWCLPSTKIDD